MTARERILSIRLIEKMKKSDMCTKNEDGTLKWTDEDGNVLVEAKTKEWD